MRATNYEPLIVRRAFAQPPEYVAFFRERLPLIFFCLAQFAVFSVTLAAIGRGMARRYGDMGVPLPNAFVDAVWLYQHYPVAVLAWAILVTALCALSKLTRIEVGVVASLVVHVFATGWLLFAASLPLVPAFHGIGR